jgi:hypothetical protein
MSPEPNSGKERGLDDRMQSLQRLISSPWFGVSCFLLAIASLFANDISFGWRIVITGVAGFILICSSLPLPIQERVFKLLGFIYGLTALCFAVFVPIIIGGFVFKWVFGTDVPEYLGPIVGFGSIWVFWWAIIKLLDYYSSKPG